MGTLRLAPATVSDYRRLAEARLPRQLFDYIDGGAVDERRLAPNREDIARIRLRQRVLRDVSRIETSVDVAGRPATMPIVLAPVGLAGLMRRRGGVRAAPAGRAGGGP